MPTDSMSSAARSSACVVTLAEIAAARSRERRRQPPGASHPIEPPGRLRRASVVHRLALALVWLAVASSAIVFAEPAPTDVLMLGAIVLLPVVGLSTFGPATLMIAGVWLVICASGLLAALAASDPADAVKHMAISLYLALASVVIAGFVARRPDRHAGLLLNAQLAGALLAAVLGIVGYFDLVPGAQEIFTRFDRASGAFKDPNVLGPFLVPAMVYALHLWFGRSLLRGVGAAVALGVLAIALLVTFSRGAWAAAAVAIVLYLYLRFVTTRRHVDRFRIAALAAAGIVAVLGVLAVAVQSDSVERLLMQRATLTQTYDIGTEGRFGGQEKAIGLIAEAPFGIGALEFPRHYHHEDVHNVFLSMYLNAGWLGGSLHLALMVCTLALGLAHAVRRTRTQTLFQVALASLAAMILEGLVIDTDHWRHLYLLLGLTWGLMLADRRKLREPRILADRRPILLKPVIVLPPSRRPARILRPTADIIVLEQVRRRTPQLADYRRPPRLIGKTRPRRPPRLLAKPG